MSDIPDLSAAGIARRIKDGELSPVAVVDTLLDRIADRNERTNAFVTVCEDLAREMAANAETAIERGDPIGPLHGVPVAIKDLDNVEGVRTTSGSLLFEDRVAEDDDVFVGRLKRAGAIIIGKTNTPEFGFGTATDNRVVGPTGTPFDPDRIAGGSSGGAAAAVADRLVPIAQGSDTGGSVRIPASCCGVFGHKPTFGLIPRIRDPNAFAGHTPFGHYGPLARTVEDAAIMLDVMAGYHPGDPFALPEQDVDYVSATERSIDSLSIAYSPDMGVFPVDPTVRDVVDDAVSAFESAGATTERADPDLGLAHDELLSAYYTMARVLWNGLWDGLEAEGFDPRGEDREDLWPLLVERTMDVPPISATEYKQADVARTRVLNGINDLLATYDLLVTPTQAVPPFPHGEYPERIDGEGIDPERGWVLTQPFNFTGHPAASVPAGFTDEGLPVGMQVVGPRFADEDVLAAAAAVERVRPWANAYPD